MHCGSGGGDHSDSESLVLKQKPPAARAVAEGGDPHLVDPCWTIPQQGRGLKLSGCWMAALKSKE